MPADYRQKAFKAKFASASRYLGVDPGQVISLKLRDVVPSYSEYHELLRVLEQEVGIHYSEVQGDLQGRGYLVDHDGQKLIIVEHETGLELLYIGGSIASLIGLVPLVLQAWGSVRGHLDRHHGRHFSNVEIRRLDAKGKLCEDHSHGLTGPSVFPLSILNTALSSAARVLDAEVHALRQEVKRLSKRLSGIEKEVKPKKKTTARRTSKKTD